ncbi:FlhC family transcriptional regulator [Sulfuricystis multivorans]|uniref:FlhC family transcriptional regulator n=1 Tax=Sulfuricystis multivorans TaxID=2211108 RepID=UPI0024DF7C32|nr:FlhC family transcriptional regulator [Sulfuricystis multivorans]
MELDRLRLARDLIKAGLRLAVVRSMTDIGTRTLRQWWKDIHGVRPSNGKLPESVLSFIKDKDSAARLSAFAAIHRRLYGATLTPETLLSTWQEFQDICCPIDINAAYFAARDVKARIVAFPRCTQCSASFIYDRGSRHTDRCPFCGTNIAA